MDFVDLVPGSGRDRDQRRRYRSVGGEAALHDHRGARRDVVAEFGVPGEMIGCNRSRPRIILIEPDGMRQAQVEARLGRTADAAASAGRAAANGSALSAQELEGVRSLLG